MRNSHGHTNLNRIELRGSVPKALSRVRELTRGEGHRRRLTAPKLRSRTSIEVLHGLSSKMLGKRVKEPLESATKSARTEQTNESHMKIGKAYHAIFDVMLRVASQEDERA